MNEREAKNLSRIRSAIKASATRATVATIQRDTGLAPTLIQKLVRQHQLNVVWKARDTVEAEGREYCEAISVFHSFCDQNQKNFRRSMIEAMQAFMNRRSSVR